MQEFYIPTESSSVHFLKSKLCVGCTKGFEIVDLETLDTQGLLDPADSSLDFVQKRENARPIAIYRIDGDFLLCYDGARAFLRSSDLRTFTDGLCVCVCVDEQSLPSTSTRTGGARAPTGSSSGRVSRRRSVRPFARSPSPPGYRAEPA